VVLLSRLIQTGWRRTLVFGAAVQLPQEVSGQNACDVQVGRVCRQCMRAKAFKAINASGRVMPHRCAPLFFVDALSH